MKREKYFRIALIFLVSFLSACDHWDEWPPYQGSATRNFVAHRSNFESLKFTIMQTDFADISLGAQHGELYVRSVDDESWRTIVDREAEEIEKFMRDSGVDLVTRRVGNIYFQLLPQRESSIGYIVRYGTGKNQYGGLTMCHEDLQDLDSGRCAVDIENLWWLEYIWFEKIGQVNPESLSELMGPGSLYLKANT